MKMQWKKWSIMVITASCIAALLCWYFSIRRSVDEDFRLPEDTKVILAFQTFSKDYVPDPFSRSELFFLNQQGQQLKHIRIKDDIWGDYLVSNSGNICMFCHNESVIINKGRPIKFSDYDEKATITYNLYGPSIVGYINDLELYYAVRNNAGGPEYASTIRFVADDGSISYDVFLPYYIDEVCYVPDKKVLLCDIWPFEDTPLTYIELKYDETLDRFVFDGELLELKNDFLLDESSIYGLLVKENFLYHLTLIWNEQEGTYSPVLSKYDLNTGNCVLNQAVCDSYSQGGYGGGGILVGSADLPTTTRNGKLYFFASDGNAYIIEDEDHIAVRPMPYTFKSAVPVSAPLTSRLSANRNFSDAIVQVGNDGEIYILIVFGNRKVRIFRLEDEGECSVFWEGTLPPGLMPDLDINDFEIVTY